MGNQLRVLFCIDSLKMGGAERITVTLMPYLTEVTPIICTLYDHESTLKQQIGSIPHICLHMRQLSSLEGIRRFLRLLQEEQIDIVHAQLQHATIFAALGQLLRGVPYVATRHIVNDDTSTAKTWRLVMVERLALRLTKQLIYVSDATSQYHQQIMRMPSSRYTTIYNGIDLTHFQSTKDRKTVAQELGFPTDKPLVVMVGVMRPGKGHTVTIDAARKLPHVNFLLAGDGEDADSLKAYAQGAENVIFLGTRKDVPMILSAVDMLVLPSDMEALPTVLIEAGAAQLPAIASDVGGIREIVMDGETGIIIPPQNPDALAQAIQRLIADPALAQRMGQAAFERIKATFTLENQARTLTELYRRVARKN